MDTSNHSEKGTSRDWLSGDRPALRVTPAGLSLLAYLDYVTLHTFVSLIPSDTVGPEAPPERYDDERTQAGTPSPKWGDYSDDNRQSDDSFDDMDDDDDDYGDHSPEED